jgi:PKD repeat protein
MEFNRRNHTPGIPKRTFGKAVFLLFVTVLLAGPAFAHVELDAPNGGEALEAGSVYRIMWHDTVDHGPADYDLWYSTTGSGGPWIDITEDVPRGPGSYDWTVPDTPSDQVRVRVRQDNSGVDYQDFSDEDLSIVAATTAETVVLEAAHDATLYEGDGSLANGSGSYIFAGRTESNNGAVERRALLAFDIADAIPAGSTITEVSLELNMSRTISGAQSVDLRRVLESWSEGPSDATGQEGGGAAAEAGDATWVHRVFPDSDWATVGGSFTPAASGSLQIGGNGEYTFSSTPQMVTDVQEWLDDPSNNHGWALVIPSPGTGSAKRFNSRENSDTTSRPKLTVTYQAGLMAPAADFSVSPSSPRVGDTVSFVDQSTGPPTTWLWDFGDGEISDEQHPTHVYDSAGTFTVSLTASNAVGSDTTTAAITVLDGDEPELTELVMIPAAANASGSAGSFFVTTVDVHNAGSATASFRFLWLPRNTDNSVPERSALFRLEPGEARRFHNFLADVFDATNAVGAAAVLSDTEDLLAMSRTFNQTTADGTFGQSLPGVAARDLIPAGTRARVLFLTENGDFRSNLGLINGVASPITIEWELFAADGTSLGTASRRLLAWGNVQLNRVLGDFAPIEAAYAHVWTMTTGGAFTCYGSVLDELSSDPTTVLPR